MDQIYDLAIIGGGINGCGIARDAAGRGLSVYLCEMNDLASATSNWSTKLVHGGLRYLEYYEFRLVREALIEREVLWRMAPHIIEPLRFVLPYHKGLRPAWMLRIGLFLYDHIGGRKLLPPTRTLDLTTDVAGQPLKTGLFRRGFEYSDCRVDDARLVVLNARAAADLGANIQTRTRAIHAERGADGWHVQLENTRPGAHHAIRAKAVVNAAGPWVADVLKNCLGGQAKAAVRLVQGSHIVVRRLYHHDRCYIFQNADGRIIFAIPYQNDFTLIGTTDLDYHGDPARVHATAEEIRYLCAAASDYFAKPIVESDVVWTYSGVRPLYDDGASEAKAATRDYVFDIDDTQPQAPLLSIFGGKITTYRKLAEAALHKLAPWLPALNKPSWTASTPLPGGEFAVGTVHDLAANLAHSHGLALPQALRLAKAYGTDAQAICASPTFSRTVAGPLTEAELRHLMDREWAMEADDVLWRRSKLGLVLNEREQAALAQEMARLATESAQI